VRILSVSARRGIGTGVSLACWGQALSAKTAEATSHTP
jgi:hypothetical protein